MATSPTHQKRLALPAPQPTSPTRERDDTTAEGSAGQQQRTAAERQALERTTTEQPKGKMRTSAIKHATRDCRQMATARNKDVQETENGRILLEPTTHDTEGLDPQLESQPIKKMKGQAVCAEIDGNTFDNRTTSAHC